MARKEAFITIRAAGRDEGKLFKIVEMPAAKAERWGMRALLAVSKSGASVPEDVRNAGMAGVASFGMQLLGNLQMAEAEVLLEEMWSCVSAVPDPGRPDIVRPLVDTDTEEIVTRLRLRAEVFSLHTNFSTADLLSTFKSAAKPAS